MKSISVQRLPFRSDTEYFKLLHALYETLEDGVSPQFIYIEGSGYVLQQFTSWGEHILYGQIRPRTFLEHK